MSIRRAPNQGVLCFILEALGFRPMTQRLHLVANTDKARQYKEYAMISTLQN